jgi:hypothetical protein
MIFKATWIAIVSLAALRPMQAQVFDFKEDRQQIVELHGLWRFHTGDDPDGQLGWAQPGFDDSSWNLLRSDQHLNVQGYPGVQRHGVVSVSGPAASSPACLGNGRNHVAQIDHPPLLQSHYPKRLASSSGGAWQGWWQRSAVRLLWAFLGSGGDGKDHPGQGNPYGFMFAIQPRSQPLSVFGAATGTAGSVVADHVAGFAVPRLIERDSAPFNGPRDGLTPHQSIPLALSITTISQD